MKGKIVFFIFFMTISTVVFSISYEIDFRLLNTDGHPDSVVVVNSNSGEIRIIQKGETLLLEMSSKMDDDFKISLWPNPSYNGCFLEFYNPFADNIELSVYDMTGRVLSRNIRHQKEGICLYNISQLPMGAYIVNVSSSEINNSMSILSYDNTDGLSIISVNAIENTQGSDEQQSEAKISERNGVVRMSYHEDDEISLLGFSEGRNHQKTIIPVRNQTVDFDFTYTLDDSSHDIFLGLIGFNKAVAQIDLEGPLRADDSFQFCELVNSLEVDSGCLFHYSFEKALNGLSPSVLPESVDKVAIVSMSSGLDVGSLALLPQYKTKKMMKSEQKKMMQYLSVSSDVSFSSYTVGVRNPTVRNSLIQSRVNQTSTQQKYHEGGLDIDSLEKEMLLIAKEIKETSVEDSVADIAVILLLDCNLAFNDYFPQIKKSAIGFIDELLSSGQPDSVIDYDGNLYKTVKIGSQIWMAENLRVTHYPDGSKIPCMGLQSSWSLLGDNLEDDAWCVYGVNSDKSSNNTKDENYKIYGALYSYAAAIGDHWSRDNDVRSSSGQGVCPDGWHLPSDDEWNQLMIAVGMSAEMVNFRGWRHTDNEGAKLKSADYWEDSSGDPFGFSAIPSGYRNAFSNKYEAMGAGSSWWSSTLKGNTVWSVLINDANTEVHRHTEWPMSTALSIRCVMD